MRDRKLSFRRTDLYVIMSWIDVVPLPRPPSRFTSMCFAMNRFTMSRTPATLKSADFHMMGVEMICMFQLFSPESYWKVAASYNLIFQLWFKRWIVVNFILLLSSFIIILFNSCINDHNGKTCQDRECPQ